MINRSFTCLSLSLALLAGSAGAAFNDIQNTDLAQAAASLNALAIMQGDGAGNFEPNRSLTRAEFTKLAATSLGLADATAYRSYTLFPDVLYTHWASGYIAAMSKSPDLAKKQIIRGNPDGTFTPEKPVTYGEACTMLLRMLDYTTADVGPIWPTDYIAKAQSLNLTKGAEVRGENDPITRADAAVMLRNTLRTPTKGGEKLYTALSGSTPIENSILLAIPETDPSMTAGQIRFYENGEIVTRPAANTLDSALIGSRGVVLFDKTATNKVRSFLPEVSQREIYKVVRAERQQLVTENGGAIPVGRKVPVIVGGALHDYIEAWYDIHVNDQVSLYYDKEHNLELISIDTVLSTGESYVWGMDNFSLPNGYRIERNGVTIERGDLKKYDVVTLNPTTQTAFVSNTRITGLYEKATPSFRFPEKIKVLATEFTISEDAAPTFDKTQLGEKVTLLLDSNNNVRAAVPEKELAASMHGIVTASSENEVTVQLFNGLTIKGPTEKAIHNVSVGQMINLSQDNKGNLRVLENTRTATNPGDWIVSRGVLGSKPVAPDVQVFERTSEGGPLYQVKPEQIGTDIISGKKVESVITDPSGTVIAMVINDATGESWVWGAVEGVSEVHYEYRGGKKDDTTTDGQNGSSSQGGNSQSNDANANEDSEVIKIPIYNYKVKITTLVDGKEEKSYIIDVDEQVEGLTGKPTLLGLPRAALTNTGEMKLTSKKPIRIGVASLADFDGYSSVKYNGAVWRVADDVPVWNTRTNHFITLRQAKADFDAFTLYADASLENSGKIRIITVS